ncbi:GntR family transcriptional regulator [Paenibacillus turpanensis]|uniref:GntR family transcriptional regulator n=1 Tax=Paenibacillus turpanensis TaxID=2689078 RepID=UPI001A9F395C|nr:GntR family transcriptional regulator [Paenibacillus turpanensis]
MRCITIEKKIPKYIQLKETLLGLIESGAIRPGDQMPSENEIADRFDMSRQTVRQTLGLLEQEGRLYRLQGKGTFVSEQSPAAKTHEVQTVGILTTYISDYIFPHIVRGAESAVREKGYRLMLSSTDNDKAREREALEMMLSEPLSGLIIEPTRSAEGNPNVSLYLSLSYQNIPFIMINQRYPEITCPYLMVDDEDGGFQAADHLLSLGHQRIAGFFKTDDLQGVNRLKGFIKAHQERSCPLSPDMVIHYKTDEKWTRPYEIAMQLLASGSARPTAFVCYNDELAVHLLEAARQSGLSVPDDLSIIGFDDSSLATATEVKLTTLSHPKMQMGVDAAQILIDMIEGRSPASAEFCKLYKPELIVRNSTKKL